MAASDRAKTVYLIILIIGIIAFGTFWLDSIGVLDIGSVVNQYIKQPEPVITAQDDEPSLLERERFQKEKDRLVERIEDLDRREALLAEKEKALVEEKDKLEDMKKGIELEQKKFEQEKKQYSGYMKNVRVLADKIGSMPPEESVKIMQQWEDPLIIDVLREMDRSAAAAGQASITSYLITLMPKDKASRIMYLMTQL